MANLLTAFNTKLFEFVEELADTYPEEKDIASALDSLRLLFRSRNRLRVRHSVLPYLLQLRRHHQR